MSTERRAFAKRHALITGGAGFIGTNLAHRLLSTGREVLLYDNLSRAGVDANVRWLRAIHGTRVQLVRADVGDRGSLERAVRGASEVYHLAAQVAVTTSLDAPVHDFEVNARGTLNLLECLRALEVPPPVVFTSTNKVYGCCEDVPLARNGSRYEPLDPRIRRRGISETRPLEFRSPYGCSKGTADQYVIDYARTFGIPAAVFRMSCIYGPHQCGNEDQGWVAHLARQVLEEQPVVVYGDGRQVRDLLFVDDLVDAFVLARRWMERLTGIAFNIGGGPENTASVLEVLERLSERHGRRPLTTFGDWRPGDQRYYVSDTRRFQAATGWRSRVGVREGISRLCDWLQEIPSEQAARGVAARAAASRLAP
jgi:CDP-paratose 2-epimerase